MITHFLPTGKTLISSFRRLIFLVVSRRVVFNSRSSETHSPIRMEQIQCSETSAIKHHTPGNNAKNYTQQGKPSISFNVRTVHFVLYL
jgi:hypothetical protein